jgi:hypothetical protein
MLRIFYNQEMEQAGDYHSISRLPVVNILNVDGFQQPFKWNEIML